MTSLSAVSETALITLLARAVESEKDNPVIKDDAARQCLERIRPHLPATTQQRILNRKLPATLTRYIALRARKYDAYSRAFINNNSEGLVVSLGCGFDTRYWRVAQQPWNYLELDLPEVIAAKKEVFGDDMTYPLIGRSVLDESWLAEIQAMEPKRILFLAEGLLMYLPKAAVIHLFGSLSATFAKALIVFEVVHERYTRGIWKRAVEARLKRTLGTDAGSAYQFGIRDASEVASYGDNIKILEEWSFLDEEEIWPKFLRLFRHVKFVARTQWTIKAGFDIG